MKIKQWHSQIDLPNRIYLQALIDDVNGLQLFLKEENSNDRIVIIFKNYLGYRNFNESERLKTLSQFPVLTQYSGLFIAEKSLFIDWLVRESFGILDKKNLIHFILSTPEDIIEIISQKPPDIKKNS